MTFALPTPRKAQRITTQTVALPSQTDSLPPQWTSSPPADAYGTFDSHKILSKSRESSSSTNRGLRHSSSQTSHLSSISEQSQHRPLLPSSQPPANDTVMDEISGDLIPFAGIISMLKRQFARSPLKVLPPGVSVSLLKNRNQNLSN